LVAYGEKVSVKLEWAGGNRANKMHWDGTISVRRGTITSVLNAGLDGAEAWKKKGPSAITFVSLTEGGTDGLVVTAEAGAGATLVFQSPILERTFPLDRLPLGGVRATGDKGAWLTVEKTNDIGIKMPRQECGAVIADRRGRLWTIGIASAGRLESAATRQTFILGSVGETEWTKQLTVAGPGAVYFPTALSEPGGLLLVAWCELRNDRWEVRVVQCDPRSGKLGTVTTLSTAAVALCPSLYQGLEGAFCAWQSGDGGELFRIRVSQRQDGKWSAPLSIPAPGHAFRPVIAGGGEDVVIAFDTFVGRDYDVYAVRLADGKLTKPVAIFASDAEEMSPVACADSAGTVWISAANRLAGLRGMTRMSPVTKAGALKGAPILSMTRDDTGRLWLVSGRGAGRRSKGLFRPILVAGEAILAGTPMQIPMTWGTPIIRGDNSFVHAAPAKLYRGSLVLPKKLPAGPPKTAVAPSGGEKAPPKPPVLPRKRREIVIGGERYGVYFGELHTHLGEHPSDRTVRTWVDRYYLRSRHEYGLDVGATSDHDWPNMTHTKFMVQQGFSKVLNQPDRYLALSGFEWSGHGPTRKRYGDRTVVFAKEYTSILRITDIADTPAKLHAGLRKWGGIDWPHHVGASWAIMDWDSHSEEIEPVIELTSNHGVYETYDREHVIAGWTKTPIADRNAKVKREALKRGGVQVRPAIGDQDFTSLQYGLSQGHQFAFVGSSDSHNGLAGYRTGMTAIIAKDLTREAIFEAWQARRAYALRGGEPILVDFRIAGAFMGQETTVSGSPKLSVKVIGTASVEKIEIVRNNEYLHTRKGNGTSELSFQYVDLEAARGKKSYYYVRVFQRGSAYAWASPIWVAVKSTERQ